MRTKHFLFAAVPVVSGSRPLYAEIIKDRDEVKRCCECGATFQPKSNWVKYCAACAKRMRRRKEAERQRKRYWQHEA